MVRAGLAAAAIAVALIAAPAASATTGLRATLPAAQDFSTLWAGRYSVIAACNQGCDVQVALVAVPSQRARLGVTTATATLPSGTFAYGNGTLGEGAARRITVKLRSAARSAIRKHPVALDFMVVLRRRDAGSTHWTQWQRSCALDPV